MEPVDPQKQQELVFGFAGAVGTDLNKASDVLEACLRQVNFQAQTVKLSELLRNIEANDRLLKETPVESRLNSYMDAGDRFRRETGFAEALALLAINEIKRIRSSWGTSINEPLHNTAYILKSLKHPKEVEILRQVYGPAFILVSVYSPANVRRNNLVRRIAKSHHDSDLNKYYAAAADLINRDESEPDSFGQNLRETFPLADIFVDASNSESLEYSLNRSVELLFGNTFETPTDDEFGMFTAISAALRSSSLARQVGAAILNENGDIVSVGMNEVPRPGGGIHTVHEKPDLRNWRAGSDPNDERKALLIGDILTRLQAMGKLDKTTTNSEEDIDRLISEIKPLLKGAHIMNVIDSTREVHAEMAALTAAARSTTSTSNCTLYTTTFPCQDCTKHLIAAGIKRVVYIEPYPKSLAYTLYSDYLDVEGMRGSAKTLVKFDSFVGVAPAKYLDLFTKVDRKDSEGRVKKWLRWDASPRVFEPYWHYIGRENENITRLGKELEEKSIKLKINLFSERNR